MEDEQNFQPAMRAPTLKGVPVVQVKREHGDLEEAEGLRLRDRSEDVDGQVEPVGTTKGSGGKTDHGKTNCIVGNLWRYTYLWRYNCLWGIRCKGGLPR